MTNGDAQERVAVMEVSQVELREQIIRVEGRMDVLETKMEGIEKRMDHLATRMDRLEARMDRLEAKMDRLMYFMIGVTVVNVGALIAALAG